MGSVVLEEEKARNTKRSKQVLPRSSTREAILPIKGSSIEAELFNISFKMRPMACDKIKICLDLGNSGRQSATSSGAEHLKCRHGIYRKLEWMVTGL